MAFAVRALPGDRPCWFGCVRPSYYIPGPPRERVREQGCWHVVGVATQRRGGGEEEKRSERRTAIRTRYGAKRERGADRRPTAGHGEADRAREAGKEPRRRKATLRFLLLRCSPPASNLYLHRTFLSLPPCRARVCTPSLFDVRFSADYSAFPHAPLYCAPRWTSNVRFTALTASSPARPHPRPVVVVVVVVVVNRPGKPREFTNAA